MQSQATPQILYDLYLDWGGDLVSSTHDINTVSGAKRSEQRVLRRLLTALNGYIWHPEYGAGLPSFIGQIVSPDNFDQIKSLILSNMFLEASVSQTPPPVISMQSIGDGIFIQISYTENPTQNPIVINFKLSN